MKMPAFPIPTLIACLAFSAAACGQSSATAQTPAPATLPDAPSQRHDASTSTSAPASQAASPTRYHSQASATYLYNVGVFCGAGTSTSPAGIVPTTGCGAGLTLVPLPIFLEVGVMGPQGNRSHLYGYMSIDGSIPLACPTNIYLPLAIVGYTRLFETGHALDYGVALALPRFYKQRDDSKSLRVELKDYCTFANPTQRNIMLRVGWMSEEGD
jgi:hypothetical protein